MIEITENRTHIMQMKDDYKIAEVKKSDVIDFGTDMTNGDQRIVFTKKNDDKVFMYFNDNDQFNNAIGSVINITNKMGI